LVSHHGNSPQTSKLEVASVAVPLPVTSPTPIALTTGPHEFAPPSEYPGTPIGQETTLRNTKHRDVVFSSVIAVLDEPGQWLLSSITRVAEPLTTIACVLRAPGVPS